MKKYKFNIQNFATLDTAIKDLSAVDLMNYSSLQDEIQDDAEMVVDYLFPKRKTESLKASFNKADTVAPVLASVHGFDTKAQIGSRDGFKNFEMEKLLVKRMLVLTEQQLMVLSNPRTQSEYNEILDKIFADTTNLTKSVKARFVKMAMDIIANGEIVIDENGAKTTLDYGVPAEHKQVLTGSAMWSDATSDPLVDIKTWSEKIEEDTGVMPTRAITSRKVLNTLTSHPLVVKAINGTNGKTMVSKNELNDFLISLDLPMIMTFDYQYRYQNEDGTYTSGKYFPTNKFVIMPEGELGEFLYGNTPTQNKMIREGKEETSGQVHLITIEETDPVVTYIKAEGLMIPTLPRYEEIFQAQVIA